MAKFGRVALAGVAIAAAIAPAPLAATPDEETKRPLEELSLEELMRVEVTVVVGTEQRQFASPAALYVITAEDIRRSGHRTLAEALRLVPGMFVQRVNAWTTVAGPRGLVGNLLTANRMLVLVDDRVVYDPLFNGTTWDVVDLVLEDVERIEVIRGPGATLWGVNAMNGVIQIVTRRAQDTQNLLAVAGGGHPQSAFGAVRYGGVFGTHRNGEIARTAYRVWAKYSDHASLDLVNGESAHDAWREVRGGFRLDGGDADRVRWTLQGDAYHHPRHGISTTQPVPDRHLEFEQVVTDDEVDGGYLRFRVGHGAQEPSGWQVQASVAHANRQTSRVGIRRDTLQLQFRQWTPWGRRNALVWGVQTRTDDDHLDDGPTFSFDPDERTWSNVNAFAQVTRALVPEHLFALVGTKLTHHDFVGFELQPSARLWWTPSERQTLWGAVSRPVRVPSRLEEDGLVIVAFADPGLLGGGPPQGIRPFGVSGDDDLEPERFLAFELGHRYLFESGWQVDAALFRGDYRRLIGIPATVVGSFTDEGAGRSHGVEARAARELAGRWRVELAASWLELDLEGPVLAADEGAVPRLMARATSSWNAGARLQVHAGLYWVDRLPQSDVESYERLDLGLTWRLRDDVELALWGQNLTDPHVESAGVEVPRGGYALVRFDL